MHRNNQQKKKKEHEETTTTDKNKKGVVESRVLNIKFSFKYKIQKEEINKYFLVFHAATWSNF